ncbi:MAG: YbjN domain-containing protein [Pararhodobacter sp.]|nr:YbjN domain-containing protein [Pararhodobacter sp.]
MALPQLIRAAAIGALVCFPVSSPLTAQAQIGGMVSGADIDRITELAGAYGPAERQFHDIDDGPWIRAEMDDVVYTISFFNCTEGENCTSVQLRAWWESDDAHSLMQMNDWNRHRRFGAAYLDINDNATIEFDVNLTGGVTALNFDDTLQWWQLVLTEFVETVIEPGYAGAGHGAGGTLVK